MRCSVVQTRRLGRRLTAQEIRDAQPVIGELLVMDWLTGNASRRALRVARLLHGELDRHSDLLHPLFDPALVRMTAECMVLAGIEVNSDATHAPVDHAQGWLIRPVARATPSTVSWPTRM
jgi:hypothetical protein